MSERLTLIESPKPASRGVLTRRSMHHLVGIGLPVTAGLIAGCDSRPVVPIPIDISPDQPAGAKYKKDFEAVVAEFIGHQYQEKGLSFRETETKNWDNALSSGMVIAFVAAGPGPTQRFMVVNSYDKIGNLSEIYIGSARLAAPTYNIDTRLLVSLGVLDREVLGSSQVKRQGFGSIPEVQLPRVLETLFNLPSDIPYQPINFCYSFPRSDAVDRAAGKIGQLRLRDRRGFVVAAHTEGQAELWVSSSEQPLKDLRDCSVIDRWVQDRQLKIARFWENLDYEVDSRRHPEKYNRPRILDRA